MRLLPALARPASTSTAAAAPVATEARSLAPSSGGGSSRHVDTPLSTALALAAALLVVVLFVQSARIVLRRTLAARRNRLRFANARRGEDRALRALEAHGYEVLGAQVATTYEVRVDGAGIGVDVRADFVVARGAKRYVAEVKTGRVAPNIETSATRRQLLEYRLAFDVDGVLLVDGDKSRVSEVVFPKSGDDSRARVSASWALAFLAAGAAFGSAAAFAFTGP